MSVETVREAARLMRERAEIALHFAGDQGREWWSAPVLVDAFTAYTGEEPGVVLWGVDKDAEHIASWPPAAALAVADLLDVIEAGWEEYDPEGPGETKMHFVCAWADNLAKAYLGERP